MLPMLSALAILSIVLNLYQHYLFVRFRRDIEGLLKDGRPLPLDVKLQEIFEKYDEPVLDDSGTLFVWAAILLCSLQTFAQCYPRVTVVVLDRTGQELRRGPGAWDCREAVLVPYRLVRGGSSAQVIESPGRGWKVRMLWSYDPENDSAVMALSRRGMLTFERMLLDTMEQRAVMDGNYPISPGAGKSFTWNQPQDALVSGELTIAGGRGDVEVELVQLSQDGPYVRPASVPARGVSVWNPGLVTGAVRVRQQLPAGVYELRFDNGLSLATSKIVSGRLYVVWYR